MKYRPVAIPGGFAVAYDHATLGFVAHSDHGTRESAQAQADRLNAMHAAQQVAANLSAALNREHALQPRRSVRWFPADAFA